MTSQTLEIPDIIRHDWEVISSGAVDVLPAEELIAKLVRFRQGGPALRVKLGADPSAPDLHLGHTVLLNKLRQFQDLGHTVVFIVGTFTARIGDPTGKSETRKALSAEEVDANAQTYLDQIFHILNPAQTEVVRNSDWFERMNFTDVIKLASHYTVARMLERDDFSKRYAEGRPIHIHEFLYPLVQGYDSIEVRADIELGGTDQKFNLLVGRELMREAGMMPQCILTMPLLVGLDGVNKMSKSLGNYISINESASEIFGKAMSVPDEMMRDYLVLTLGYPEAEAARLLEDVAAGRLHPRDLKARIAQELAARYRGAEEAQAARERFDKVFKAREIPEDIETVEEAGAPEGVPLARILASQNVMLAKSVGEAKRKIQEGGVSVDGKKIDAIDSRLTNGEHLLKLGRHYKRVRLV